MPPGIEGITRWRVQSKDINLKLKILVLALTVLLLAACAKPTASPSQVPQRSTPETPKVQATLAPAGPEASPAASIPEPSPASGMPATPVPTPTVQATSEPTPANSISPIPTAEPARVPRRRGPSTPTPDIDPTPTHEVHAIVPKPTPTTAVRQPPPRIEYPEPENTPEGTGERQQPRFGAWLPPADCAGEDVAFSVSPVDRTTCGTSLLKESSTAATSPPRTTPTSCTTSCGITRGRPTPSGREDRRNLGVPLSTSNHRPMD